MYQIRDGQNFYLASGAFPSCSEVRKRGGLSKRLELLQPGEGGQEQNGAVLVDKGCSGTPHLHPPAIRPGGQGVPESHVGAARDLWGS